VASKVQFSNRLENLSWSHHREAASLDEGDQAKWLKKAEEKNWDRRELAKEVKDWQRGVKRQELALEAGDQLATLLLVDPPWSYRNSGLKGAADEHYKTMETDAICALLVASVVTDQAVMFMWATNPLLRDALRAVLVSPSANVAVVDPAATQDRLARSDAVIDYAKTIKDWPLLERAVAERWRRSGALLGVGMQMFPSVKKQEP
jgi:hypothetical protein